MPRTPRNPGSGKPPVNTPAAGPGAGSWGTGQSAGGCTTFDELKSLAAIALRDDPEAKATRDERAAAMLAVHFDVALHDPSGAARSNAADKALDRLLGRAVQKAELKLRTMNPDEMTDEELAAIAAGGRAAASGEADASG